MKPSVIRAALAAAIIGVGTAGGIVLAQAPNPASAPSPGYGPGYGGMGPGMMQGGSMGPGMMRPYQQQPERPPTASSAGDGASRLVEYIQAQRLSCLQCHALAGGGYAPPFAFIAQREAGRPGAESMLAGRITDGYGGMPPGLADQAQAARLAAMILALEPSARGPDGGSR